VISKSQLKTDEREKKKVGAKKKRIIKRFKTLKIRQMNKYLSLNRKFTRKAKNIKKQPKAT
jgi:hypothetical protein